MNLKYLITNKEDFEAVIDYIKDEDIIGIDTETNAKFSPLEVALVGISIGFDDFSVYIPLMHDEGDQLSMDYVLGKLKPILEDENQRYVWHNAKFDEMVFSVYGIECKGSGDDTYILQWLINESRAKGERSLKSLTLEYLGVRMETYEEVVDKRPRKRGSSKDYNFARVSLEDALSYAADDAYFTLRLFRKFSEIVRKEQLWDCYENIERPLLRPLRHIETRGLFIDKEYIKYADTRYPQMMEELESQILQEAGEFFNIDSPQQLGEMLFDTLAIGNNVPRTKTGQYSTDAKTLAKYEAKYPIVEKILRRKKIKKAHGTFVEGILKFVEQDGRLRASFNSTGTGTGRFSSNEPNMQNIPADEIEEIKVRDFFIPSVGYVFVVTDYQQIELRVMAHVSNDETAINAFLSGKKFHDEAAREVFKIPQNEPVSHKYKIAAKTLNFGIPYGRGPSSVAEQLGIDPWCKTRDCGECGACYIEKWFQAFPRVRECRDRIVEGTRQRGYMRTISGRKRRLPHICSPDNKLRYSAERQAFNTYCQGSAADIIKLAMVQLYNKLLPLDAHMLIQVHDELVVECPEKNASKVVEIMQKTMENPLNGSNPLRLPLVAEPVIVKHWSEAK